VVTALTALAGLVEVSDSALSGKATDPGRNGQPQLLLPSPSILPEPISNLKTAALLYVVAGFVRSGDGGDGSG
jgi:hypothetical protein